MAIPTYPTLEEMEIYKSPVKQFEVKAAVRLDHPIFTSPFHDHFDGTALNTALWDLKKPTWGVCTVAGSTVTLGTSTIAICPPWMTSKPNLAFPKDTRTSWQLDARLCFPTVTGFGVFFRVCSLWNHEAIFAVKCATGGIQVKMPDRDVTEEGVLWDTPGHGWIRVRLVYDAHARTYIAYIDTNDDGTFEEGPFTISAVNFQADYIAVGNTTARQGFIGNWTEIEVDYVTVTGVSETYELPDWAGPQYLYDAVGYENELWSFLPSVLKGSIDIALRNDTDGLTLDLLNFMHGYDRNDPMWQVYTNFSFLNRPIKVLSRVNNGYKWTRWRQIYIGSCDEKNIELRSNGDCVLTVAARDLYRKQLAMVHLVQAYAKYDTDIEGLVRNKVVSEIITDIAVERCGLPDRAIDVICTPANMPQTFNVSRESGADAIQRLLEETALCWYVDHEQSGQILVRDYPWGTDTPGYRMSTAEEIESVQWREGAGDIVGILELNVENSEFEAGGFSTNHPHAPVPFFGHGEYRSTLTAQNAQSLYSRPLHKLLWQIANRGAGSLRVTMQCQDWPQLTQEVSIRDDKYLGIKESHGPWIVDGVGFDWEGTKRFETTLELANQHPDRILRRSLQGAV